MNSRKKSPDRQNTASRSAIIKPYVLVSYLSVALFVGLIAYMIYFQVERSRTLLNSPLNKRQNEIEAQVIRGSIVDTDGTILAETVTGEDGESYRRYPYGGLFAHTVGYGVYGGSGLESSHHSELIRSHKSLPSQVQDELNQEKKQGDVLYTTLDADLQQAAYDALLGMRGTVIVMEAKTGKVLADVSSPSFDPNTVSEDWEWLVEDESGIFLNRAMQGLYPPGSTFKMITALAYLRQYGSFDGFYYECTGTYEHAGFTIHCANGRVHGMESLSDAMANSCNCAFASIAVEKLDKEILRKTAEECGFNSLMQTDLPFTESVFALDADTADQLAMQTAIGQGDTLATPMLMCMIAQAIANDGTMRMPQFADHLESADGHLVKNFKNPGSKQIMTKEEAAAIRTLLADVTRWGTAADLADLPWPIYGKTGTAEYGEIADGRAHSWFVGFTDTGGKDIVVCALVEDGGDGTLYGSQVARSVIQATFALRQP